MFTYILNVYLLVYLFSIIFTILFFQQKHINKYYFKNTNLKDYSPKIQITFFKEEELDKYTNEIPLNNTLIDILKINMPKEKEDFKIHKINMIYNHKEVTINIIQITNINLEGIISYINTYHNKNISFNFLMKNLHLNILYFIFFPIISSTYILYLYFKLIKFNKFIKQHKDFTKIYIDNISILKIQIKLMSIIVKIILIITILFLIFFNLKLFFLLIIFSILIVIKLYIFKLYKHFIFIEKLKKIHFIDKNKLLYINKNQLNLLIDIINNI